jgi:hypothetical protein
LKKNYSWKFFFYYQKLQFTYPYASIKDVQATEEAFSPQKYPALQNIFSTFKGNFCPPGSGSGSGSGSTDLTASGSNPDTKNCSHLEKPLFRIWWPEPGLDWLGKVPGEVQLAAGLLTLVQVRLCPPGQVLLFHLRSKHNTNWIFVDKK